MPPDTLGRVAAAAGLLGVLLLALATKGCARPYWNAGWIEDRLWAVPDAIPARRHDAMIEAVDATEEAAEDVGLQGQLPTLCSMWMLESSYRPSIRGRLDRDSVGLCQTREGDFPRWRAFWAERGVILAPFADSIRTQAFYGVAEFWTKLRDAHGSVNGAIRRYNGSGPRARRYLAAVLAIRKRVFGISTRNQREPLQ